MIDSNVLLPSSEVLFQKIMPLEKTAADFFAGIGLASAGLIKQSWQVKYYAEKGINIPDNLK